MSKAPFLNAIDVGPIVAVGEVLWDILPSGAVLGGAPANFIYRSFSLGREAYLVSALGNDKYGNEALIALHALGFDTQFIQRNNFPTGTVAVTLADDGDASYDFQRGTAYDKIEITEGLLALVQSCSYLCFGTLGQRDAVSRATLGALVANCSGKIVCDINLRRDCFSPESVRWSLEQANVLKLNDDEVAVVRSLLNFPGDGIEEFVAHLMTAYPKLEECLVTMGARGAAAFDRTGVKHEARGYQVKVADTVGSGDSFTAGYLDARLKGMVIAEALTFANQIGALVATVRGGMSNIDLRQIHELVPAVALTFGRDWVQQGSRPLQHPRP
jgi:fructokinase